MFRNINAGAPHNFIPIAIHHHLSIEIHSQTEEFARARAYSLAARKTKKKVKRTENKSGKAIPYVQEAAFSIHSVHCPVKE